MPLTASDITGPLPPSAVRWDIPGWFHPMDRLRASLAADGWSATSPATLDPEAELIARLERQDP